MTQSLTRCITSQYLPSIFPHILHTKQWPNFLKKSYLFTWEEERDKHQLVVSLVCTPNLGISINGPSSWATQPGWQRSNFSAKLCSMFLSHKIESKQACLWSNNNGHYLSNAKHSTFSLCPCSQFYRWGNQGSVRPAQLLDDRSWVSALTGSFHLTILPLSRTGDRPHISKH